jgi:AhpD family alkylhydroperoxidase
MTTTTEPAVTITPRLKNPAALLPGSFQAISALMDSIRKGGAPRATLELVHLRVSQVNGCSACVGYGWRNARQAGETDERLFSVAAWREAPYFTAAERAALALAEAVTRIADSADPVPDQVWDEAARHFDDRQLAAVLMMIATTNVFNRLNVATRQPAGPVPATWG